MPPVCDDVRFVTLAGEVVNADGSVVAGPKDVAGLISRRTELRDLRREESVLREQIAEAEQEIERLSENIEQQQVAVRELSERHQAAEWQLGRAAGQVADVAEPPGQLAEEIASWEAEQSGGRKRAGRRFGTNRGRGERTAAVGAGIG